jgi:hypothetical protein
MKNYEYQLGGSLPFDAPSYVKRQADRDLYQALKEGHFCYVLNCRQMGKSSLGLRTCQQLRKEGIKSEIIIITLLVDSTTSEEWYGGMIGSLIDAFMPLESFDLLSWWQNHSLLPPAMRLSEFVEKILLKYVT